MKIGIIVHSKSGYTARVARLLGEAFNGRGDEADTLLLHPVGEVNPRSTSFELKAAPSVDGYDIVILGAPVWAFAASPVIMKYIRRLGPLSGKKLFCFVTKGLPFSWTGGIHALATMQQALAHSGAALLPGEIIWAPGSRTEAKLKKVVDRIVAACTA